ncbi:TetR/AcrR family transcriptional regulator [Luteibacter sp. UNCMF366Tsu5.1]|uniref:TetR/AcrR family transcriptional regulator n=1 Tax=Luteibacter sp. UNCMF366Tsu5.1 TaxID=1502758 RepID=UPI001C443468|nr:TetR/AcrR family transcriptional regulator [Luteibacter sp. UNCMF366Tsu5.1]
MNKTAMTGRSPRQARGQARIDTVLKSAAELIAEQGLAGVTMHSLARRANTSIGSLYHFFPDRESVLEAARQRHVAATHAISEELGKVPAAEWRRLSAAAVIDRLSRPFITYLRSHADYLPLTSGRLFEEDSAGFLRVMRQVLSARLPTLDESARDDYALMLHLIASGAMHAGLQLDASRVDLYLREIPLAMTAYLERVESAAGH